MAKATKGASTGVWWVNGDILSQDFAGDITLLDSRYTWRGVNELTWKLHEEAANVGFIINPEMTNIKEIGK